MLHYFYAALLSICSITGIVGCESTISDYELQEASQPLEGQLVGKNYSKRVEFVPREWRIDVDIGLLPIERTRNEENRAKLLENFRNALFNLEAAYPDVSLASMLQIANYSKQLARAVQAAEKRKTKTCCLRTKTFWLSSMEQPARTSISWTDDLKGRSRSGAWRNSSVSLALIDG